jgi:CHAT domain-containing protein/putative hemolysin
MPKYVNSYQEAYGVTCSHCQGKFTAELWLIVDGAEWPDLLERVQGGSLRRVSCGHCGQETQVAAPLLVYREGQEPPLLYVGVEHQSARLQGQELQRLVRRLLERLGVVNEDWLFRALKWLNWSELLELLSQERPNTISSSSQGQQKHSVRQTEANQPQDNLDPIEDNMAQLRPLLKELQKSAESQDLPRRINLLQQALKLLPRESKPRMWASLQGLLGNALAQNPLGDHAENLEQAITIYDQVLTVMTQTAMPVEWAATMMNLANAYSDRIRGDQAENIEQAISTYEQALTVRTQTAMPVEWAQTMNNLANVYYSRIQGDRAENIEQAIFAYEQALTVRTQTVMPVKWADTMNSLANVYYSRIRGDRAENIEQAIKAYEQALTMITQTAMPVKWAATMDNLASAYRNRIQGDLAENIEQAIFAYEQALTVRTQIAMPVDWAKTMNNLASAYSRRIRGDHAKNIEQAIFAYEQALTVITHTARPVDWAKTMHNLAGAYSGRIRGDRAENIEQAIKAYEQALTVITQTARPVDWAQTKHSLANAYSRRIQGDRAENIEQAIKAYEQVLTVRTQTARPVDWAQTKNSLAAAYYFRIRGNRADNIEQAIKAYEQVLTVRTQTATPVDWANTMNNLANAYADRIRGNRAENIEQAISAYDKALMVITQTAMPVNWAEIMNNLALTYSSRIRGDQDENVEQAIVACEQALTVMTQENLPVDWATTLVNLAIVYCKRIRGDQAKNIEQAISVCEQALTQFQPDLLPNDCRRTARLLGNLYINNQCWSEATQSYTLAITAAENLYQASLFRSSQEAELAETNDLHRRAAYAQAQNGDLRQALILLEQGRARGLTETLQRDRANLEAVKNQAPDLYQRYQQAANQLRQLESTERNRSTDPNRPQPSPDDLRQQATHIHNEINTCIAQIRQIESYQNFLALPQWQDIAQSVQPDQPLIYLVTTPVGSLALILHTSTPQSNSHPQITPVWLNDFNDNQLQALVSDWFGAYDNRRQEHQAWLEALEQTCQYLWDQIMEPIVTQLQTLNLTQATLIPTGFLGFLPLHAAWTADNTRPTGRRYALDDICFTYAPNALSLQNARAIAQGTGADSILAIDEPQPTSANPLPSSSPEVAAVIAHFPHKTILKHTQAIRSNALETLQHHNILHLSCHGSAKPSNPLNSGLLMAHDEILSLRNLLDLKLQGVRLAVLSACETNIPGTELPDEVISLPTGLLQANVAGIVASLWSVSDLSTMLLITRFYQLWHQENHQPAEALRQAQLWLRDSPGYQIAPYLKNSHPDRCKQLALRDTCDFAHPYHWAAFTYTGA